MLLARIYIRNRNVNADHLSEIFGKFGAVVRVNLVRERGSKVPKGFAFVEFKSHEDAESAQDHMHDGWLDGKKVRVRFATEDDNRRSRSVEQRRDSNGNRAAGRKQRANGRRGGRDNNPRKRSFSPPRGRRSSFSPARNRSPGARSRQRYVLADP
jgi:RNA recognition motif-containing protein